MKSSVIEAVLSMVCGSCAQLQPLTQGMANTAAKHMYSKDNIVIVLWTLLGMMERSH